MSTLLSPKRLQTAVIGGGSWGTALASVLAEKHEVKLWARDLEIVQSINQNHYNPKYHSEFQLSNHIKAVHELDQAIENVSLIVLVVPSHAMKQTARQIGALVKPGTLIISASKGIENETLHTMEEVLNHVMPRAIRSDLCFLSGPSFAKETLEKSATAVTVASRFQDVAQQVQAWMSTHYFKIYTTEDVTGVELGGALKNVMAIAAGVADGLGLGYNSRAALITRGLAEMTRLAVKMGANPLTLSGLAGMGDLILTCTGSLSRNRHVGEEIGKGKNIDEIVASMNQVAEGVKTTQSAYLLSKREGVEMPIVSEVYAMLYENKPAKQAFVDLMGRSLKNERVW
jgi:glycerol-3-phosphate dehydrogenase (NAD(P)+)